MRNYYDVAPKLQENFYDEERERTIIEFLGDKHDLFWDYINLTFLISHRLLVLEKQLGQCGFILSSKFINHSASAYKMLCGSMVDEFFIMYRQCCEVQWLLQYFVQFPDKEWEWLSSKNKYIPPGEVRDKLDHDQSMKRLYDFLSENAHPKTKSIYNIFKGNMYIGGTFDPQLVNSALSLLLSSIGEFIETLYEIIAIQQAIQWGTFLYNVNDKSQLTEFEELVVLSHEQRDLLFEKLQQNNIV